MSVVDPYQIKVRYGEILVEQTECVAEGDRLRLKTPLLLPDGRNIQVYIRTGPNWTVVVSDGGVLPNNLRCFPVLRTSYELGMLNSSSLPTNSGLITRVVS